MRNFVDMTKGSINAILARQTIPMLFGMVSMVLFNLTDTWFVARLGTHPLAAMSFTLPVVMFFGAISMGLGVATSAIVAQRIGLHDEEGSRRFVTDALLFSLLTVVVFVFIGLATLRPLFSMLGADDFLMKSIHEYMFIWYLGLPFVIIPMVGNNAIRAAGNTMIPSITMLAAVCINIILDPLLIFGLWIFPRMELRGAAIATVIARAVTLVVALLFLHYRFGMLTRRFEGIKRTLSSWVRLLSISIPATFTQLMTPISMFIITRLIAGYGVSAIAAIGVGSRLESFVLSPIMALGAVLTPFAGQNYSSGNISRIRKAALSSVVFSILYGLALSAALAVFRVYLAQVFSQDASTVRYITLYLMAVPIGFGFQGVNNATTAILSGMNRQNLATILNAGRAGILILCCFLGSLLFGATGVFVGISVASIIAGSLSLYFLNKTALSAKENIPSPIVTPELENSALKMEVR